MSSKPVVLILGAGRNIGANVARVFSSKGYSVALAARSLQDQTSADGYLHIQADFANPDSVKSVFARVSKTFGPPAVVVYNAAASTLVPASDPLTVSLEEFSRDLVINTTSAFAAAKEAVAAFGELSQSPSSSKTFIYTGNGLNTQVAVRLLTLGVGKSATAHLIQAASQAYTDRGFKFYYADERKEDGSVAGGAIDGAAHADFYAELAAKKDQGPWLATFVKNKGYVKFPAS